MARRRCWGFHASVIPDDSMPEVVDKHGERWARVGPRLWSHPDHGVRHESWLCREHGPVRCPVEDLVAPIPA